MAKRKKQVRNDQRAAAPADVKADPELSPEDQISYSSLSLHDLFEQHQDGQSRDPKEPRRGAAQPALS